MSDTVQASTSLWELLPLWAGAIASFAVAYVAAFQAKVRSWTERPVLNVSAKAEAPDCTMMLVPIGAGRERDEYYIRLWVKNEGDTAARNVEVFADAAYSLTDGRRMKIAAFQPFNLKWAYGGEFVQIISPGLGRHCDLGAIVGPEPIDSLRVKYPRAYKLLDGKAYMSIAVGAPPRHGSHIFGPGERELHISVAAENAYPRRFIVSIYFDGEWTSNAPMFEFKHFRLSVRRVEPDPDGNCRERLRYWARAVRMTFECR